jgi:molybdenum cofactor cytidylyltransferase
MGKPKLLLPWEETSILGHLITRWRDLGADQVIVACASNDTAICAELDRLRFPLENRIYNPETDRGMFSSILCATQWPGWRASLSHWAIVLGDQPHLQRNTLEKLLNFAAEHPEQVCQPTRNGKRGHPVIFPRPAFFEIAQTRSTDLKEFLTGQQVAGCECDDPGLDLDIDRPEDYQKALALAGLEPKS